jgi:PLP dependent protein
MRVLSHFNIFFANMAINKDNFNKISRQLAQQGVTLVAVSKTKPAADILELYQLGQRDFGENYVQELVDKEAQLPKDIRWHFIGHLQSNKVKYIAPFVHLIHGVDSAKLLTEINKQGAKNNRIIPCLLQVHIAQEETKFGFDEAELRQTIDNASEAGLQNACVKGLMGMASFTENAAQVKKEFALLKSYYGQYKEQTAPPIAFDTLSMGMSGDYETAIAQGSNMVRIGSLLFGSR